MGFNPQLDVNCNLITFYDSAAALNVTEQDYIGFVLFPNPTNGFFAISSGGKTDQHYTVTITDVIGNEVQKFTWNGEYKVIDLSARPKGVYIVRTGNGRVEGFRKLVLQ